MSDRQNHNTWFTSTNAFPWLLNLETYLSPKTWWKQFRTWCLREQLVLDCWAKSKRRILNGKQKSQMLGCGGINRLLNLREWAQLWTFCAFLTAETEGLGVVSSTQTATLHNAFNLFALQMQRNQKCFSANHSKLQKKNLCQWRHQQCTCCVVVLFQSNTDNFRQRKAFAFQWTNRCSFLTNIPTWHEQEGCAYRERGALASLHDSCGKIANPVWKFQGQTNIFETRDWKSISTPDVTENQTCPQNCGMQSFLNSQ